MSHPPPGTTGFFSGVALFLMSWWGANKVTAHYDSFEFDPGGEPGAFEKLLAIYIRAAEVVIGLAAGSIVLLVCLSAHLHSIPTVAFHGTLPRHCSCWPKA